MTASVRVGGEPAGGPSCGCLTALTTSVTKALSKMYIVRFQNEMRLSMVVKVTVKVNAVTTFACTDHWTRKVAIHLITYPHVHGAGSPMSRLDLPNVLSSAKGYSPERLQSPVSPPLSYISARRPSLTPHPDVFTGSFRSTENQSSQPVQYSGLRNETSFEAEEEEEDANFRQSLQIDMKTLLGDAVGNVNANLFNAPEQ